MTKIEISHRPLIEKMIYTTGDLVSKVAVTSSCNNDILQQLQKHIHSSRVIYKMKG